MVADCRKCGRKYLAQRVPAEDDHGRIVAFVTNGWPWCPACTDVIQGAPAGRGVPTEDLQTK